MGQPVTCRVPHTLTIWDFQEEMLFSYHFFLTLVTGKFSLVGHTADGSLNDRIWQEGVCFMKSTVQDQCAAKEY